MPKAYYNEIDKFSAAWLRELIKEGLIAPGDVDERSIEDVTPNDLVGYTQHHFFAGIGVWSRALRNAGWPDSRPVWTGSCPCQPFSQAGKGDGFADERHLWPAFYHLISQHQPATIFGEQVASKNTDAWFDLVHADLEAMGYAFGCVPFPAAGIGAPHLRDRAYWVAAGVGLADSCCNRLQGRLPRRENTERENINRPIGCDSAVIRMADTGQQRLRGIGCELGGAQSADKSNEEEWQRLRSDNRNGSTTVRLADTNSIGSGERPSGAEPGLGSQCPGPDTWGNRPGPTNGEWADTDWLRCRDGKWRPVKSGIQPLADVGQLRNRVGLLRGAGNAITLAQAEEFISSFLAIAAYTILPANNS